MTGVKISGEKGYWEMRDFPTPSEPHFYGSWDKSKNPCIPIEKSHNSQQGNCWGPETTRLQAEWFLCPDTCLVGNYAIS